MYLNFVLPLSGGTTTGHTADCTKQGAYRLKALDLGGQVLDLLMKLEIDEELAVILTHHLLKLQTGSQANHNLPRAAKAAHADRSCVHAKLTLW